MGMVVAGVISLIVSLIGGGILILIGRLIDKQTTTNTTLTAIQISLAKITTLADTMEKQQEHHAVKLDDHENRITILEQK